MPNRNQISHFAINPKVDIQRSRFPMDQNIKFTGNAGDIIPFFCAEVLPGDTFDVSTSLVCRMQTLIHPLMDNLYLDTYYFFVPNRLVWDNWQHFCGEPDKAWMPSREYTVPQIQFQFTLLDGDASAPADAFCGSILDYMGCALNPVFDGDDTVESYAYLVNALPVRAYNKIYDDWFRDENLIDPVNLYTGDATRYCQFGKCDGHIVRPSSTEGGNCYKAAKYHDYFTSALPQPQRGDPVNLFQEITPTNLYAPVYARNENSVPAPVHPLKLQSSTNPQSTNVVLTPYEWPSSSAPIQPLSLVDSVDTSRSFKLSPINLWADLRQNLASDVSLTVNDLRMAFQVQKFMERSASYGARYIELLKGMFGVNSPDARLQRTEYLGGHRVPINIHQIVNQTESVDAPLGNVVAMSLTTDVHKDFIHSFVEHGYVIGCCVIRYKHSYSQGQHRMWSRRTKFDFYWPVFANLGEQAVSVKEIFVQPDKFKPVGGSWTDLPEQNVFGYQERWAEYRYAPDRIAGELRPGITNSLASWHLGDYYTSEPTLSEDWINESISPIDRAIAVTSSVSNQFLFDILIKNMATRPMPVYSIPGLADHH